MPGIQHTRASGQHFIQVRPALTWGQPGARWWIEAEGWDGSWLESVLWQPCSLCRMPSLIGHQRLDLSTSATQPIQSFITSKYVF